MSYHGLQGALLGLNGSFDTGVHCSVIRGRFVCTSTAPTNGQAPVTGAPCPTGQLRLAAGCCPIPKIMGNRCCGPDQLPAYGRKCPPLYDIDNQLECCSPGRQILDDPLYQPQVLTVLPTYGAWAAPPAPPAGTPTCLDAASAMFVAGCLTGPGACTGGAALKALQLLNADLPLCPDQESPPLPTCVDEPLARTIAYCDTGAWKNEATPESAACFLLTRDPARYAALKQQRFCDEGEEPEKEGKGRGLLYAGIAVAAVVAVGAVLVTRKR